MVNNCNSRMQSQAFSELSDRYPVMAIVLAGSVFAISLILIFTQRLAKIDVYLHSFLFLKNHPRLIICLMVVYYMVLAVPLVILVVLTTLLIINIGVYPGVPVLLYGLLVLLLIVPSSEKLYNYKVLAVFCLLLAAQIVTLVLNPYWDVESYRFTFNGISAVLLGANGIVVSCVLWLVDGKFWALQDSLGYIREEFLEYCPIWKNNSPSLVSGGAYASGNKSSLKKWIILGLYVLSLGILIAYSVSVYYFTDEGILACIVSIALFTSDGIIFLIISITGPDLAISPTSTSIFAMAIRVIMFASSADYWYIGYSVLYLVLMLEISELIIDKYYPNFDRIPNIQTISINLIKTPEFVGVTWILVFAAMIVYLSFQSQIDIPANFLPIGENHYPFWQLGIGVILISLCLHFYLCSLRIVRRKMNRIREINKYFFCCKALTQYYIHGIIAYGFAIVTGFYFFSIVRSHFIWLCAVFLPLIYESIMVFYRNWKINDYLILGNVEKFNQMTQRANEARERAEQKKKQLIDQLKESKLKAIMNKTMIPQRKKTSMRVTPAIYDESYPVQDESLARIHAEISDSQVSVTQQIANNKLFFNWRSDYSACEALWKGKLLPSDKKIVANLPFLCLSLLLFSLVDYFGFGSTKALTICVQVVVMLMALLPIKKFFQTLNMPTWYQIMIFFGGLAINYIYGGFCLTTYWRAEQIWIIWWGFVNLIIIELYGVKGLLRDYGYGIGSIGACTLFALSIMCMGIYVLFEISIVAGVVILGVSLYISYFLAAYLVYLKHNKTLPRMIVYLTMGILLLTALTVMIAGYIIYSLDDFLGFCITYMIINVIIMGYGVYLLYRDIDSEFERPNFFSPFGLPVYKVDPNIHSAIKNNTPTIIIIVGVFMLLILTLLVHIFVTPVQVGVCLTVVFEIILWLGGAYLNNYNTYRAGKICDKIGWRVIEGAWEEVKVNMNKLKQIDDEETELYSHYIQTITQLESDYKSEQKETRKSEILMNINDLEERKEKEEDEMFLVAVNLWMTITNKVQGERKKEITKLVNFVNSKENGLADEGVVIVADHHRTMEMKYLQVMKDFKLLTAEQQIKFEQCFDVWCLEEEERLKRLEQQRLYEEEQKAIREAELLEKLFNLEPEDPNVPIDEMRDSLTKYRKIMEQQKKNDQLFVDNQFLPSNDIVTNDQLLIKQISKWIRPAPDTYLIDDTNPRNEVQQGNLGDCFLVSAIGIIGLANLKKMLGVGEWENPRGGYMVKFKKVGVNIHSIVDDYLPVDEEGKWFLGRCESEKELFVNIIEKAYAKMYGSYINIIGGKVHIALSEMTGGFPSEITLEVYREKDLNELYHTIDKYNNNGYLLGAGTPENPQGDKAISEDGIVQGHAYQILDVRNLDGNKLIRFRNPHGKQGAVWTGDWSKNSVKWSARLKGLLGSDLEEDGTFWMNIDDVVYEFKSLYVCMLFEDSIWKKKDFKGKWEGKKAAGLPSKNYTNVKMKNNPQYGVKVSNKSILFVELIQNEVLKSAKGKNYIFYLVQRNSGNRIRKLDVQKLCGKADSVQNSTILSGEISLEARSYPYTFSIMVACINPGDVGSFTLRLYSNDLKVEFIEDCDFDT